MIGRTAEGKRLPVIVDTDVAADDWMAMLFLLRHPDVEVRAVLVSATGEAHAGPGVRTAANLLALARQAHVPVAVGRESPLMGNHAFPDHVRRAVDEVMGLTLPENPAPDVRPDAVALLHSTLLNCQQKAVLVALGPLTNLGEAVQRHFDLARYVEMLYVMGGAVDVPGNLHAEGEAAGNVFAEWNLYCDPYAADIVFQSGLPITLVPLDATNQVPMTREFRDRLARDRTTPEADFVHRIIARTEAYFKLEYTYFWDPLAAAIATDNSLGHFEERKLKVVYDEGGQSGRTVESADGMPIRVCVGVDVPRFEQFFVDVLNGRLASNRNKEVT